MPQIYSSIGTISNSETADIDPIDIIIDIEATLTLTAIEKSMISTVYTNYIDCFIDKNIIIYNAKQDDKQLFKNLVLKANYIEYYPDNVENIARNIENKNRRQKNKNAPPKVKKLTIEKKEMTLEEIYEQFWEFIDDDNREFREFIIKDQRRENNF